MKNTLEKLSQEIESLDLSAERKEELRHLVQQLDQEAEEANEDAHGILDDLKAKVEEVETAHPALI